MKLYYTYGVSGHAYPGGWTEVEAEDRDTADAVFMLYHPSPNGFIPCARVYTEERFKNSSMYTNGNFGAFCHERITLIRTNED